MAAMPRESHDRFSGYFTTVDLPDGKVLHRPNDAIETVYFPLNCLISVTVTMADGKTSEAGVVGNREMVGINAFMGGRETNQTEYVAQVPGLAVQMPANVLLAEFDRSKALRDVLLRYTQAYIAQLSQNVACNRQHDLNQRLARWLLESCDRIQSDDVGLTQEFISQMLGVRRSGVGDGLAALQAKGLIESGRKSVKIANLAGLKGVACECYQVIRDEYDRLLGIHKP